MKRYILNITTLVVAIFSANIAWGQTNISGGTWAGGSLSGSYKLTGNTTLTSSISVASGKTLTVDLNGFTLDRKGTKAADFVFLVDGTLNIEDNSKDKTGKIQGGRGDRGGCALISGTVNFKGGEITGCISTDGNYGDLPTNNTTAANQHYVTQGCGGAFFVNSGATLNMSGTAKITNCKTEKRDGSHGRGGAVFVAGTFKMSAGTISGCESSWGGAVYVFHGDSNPYYDNDTRSGAFEMTGGTITGCKSFSDGCGVFTQSKVDIGGTAKITSNRPLKWDALQLIDGKYPNVQLSGGHGGAIYATGDKAVVTMSGGELSNNLAESGGAVMLWTGSTMTMTGGKMDGNYAMGKPSLGNGGALYLQGSTFNFEGGTLSNNVANRYGGAINTNQGATLNISGNCIISGNKASHGGGISQEAGECSLTLNGAGIQITNNEAHGHQVNISDSGVHSVTNNPGNGGGIFIEKGTVTMNGAKIKNNNASGHGGGASLYVNRIHGRKTSVNIKGGEISNNSAQYGGGIDVYANYQSLTDTYDKNDPYTGKSELTVNFQAGTLSGNNAENGAGIYVSFNETYSTASMTIGTASDTPVINNNIATKNGGGFGMTNQGVITVNNISASGNQAANGGAIWLGTGTFNITNGSISDNNATLGGGIYVGGGTFTTKGNINANSNTATQNGGAIYMGNGTFTISKGSIISNNNTATQSGGAIYMEQGNFSVNGDITMNKNQAGANGGALYLGGGKVNASSGVATIQSNTADVNGGAIYVGSGSVTLQKATISGNKSGNGGAIYAKGNVTINDEAMIDANIATGNGGAIYVEGGSLTTKKVTASSNSAKNGGVFFVKGGNVNLGVMDSGSTVTQVAAAEVTSNTASGNGGAIALENGVFTMHNDSKISSNSAGGYGGALYIKNASATSINCKGGTFSNNTAKAGGAVCADGPITLALAANIENNTAQVGGGIYMVNGVNMTFGDASQPLGLIRANKAEGTTISGTANGMNAETDNFSGVGGGIFMADGTGSNITTLKFANPKELGIYNNSASFAGADICANGNNTSITLPKTSEMNLTGFDVPGNMLYWAEDFANGDTGYSEGTGIRYEDELRAQSPNVKHFSADRSHEVDNYVCLDLGYDLVFVKIKNIGLQLNDDCAVTISYDKVQTDANGEVIKDGNGNPTYVLTEYRKILFSGKGTANDNNNSVYDTEIGLPSNDSWKFKVTQWSYKYDGVEFNPGEQKRNNALATAPDAIYGISKEGIKWNNGNDSDRLITIKHILKKDGSGNDINIGDFNTRVVNKMIPGGSSSN